MQLNILSFCKYFSVFFLTWILASCAQQTSLTGGEKDTYPPQLDSVKREVPLNGSTQFNSKTIEINFNEIVSLKNPDKQILITPFLNTKPEIYSKGKKVIINFKEQLKPSTTYIVNFGDAIVDISEGNVFRNYKYVFSTGSFIDSIQYQGVVYDSYTKKAKSDVLVMLYKNQSDSVVNNMLPDYFGLTDVNGLCTIDNIAEGSYKVVTLDDQNGNYKFDPKEEAIGSGKQFNSSTDSIIDTMLIYIQSPEKLEILNCNISNNGKGILELNKPLNLGLLNLFDDSITTKFLNEEYRVSTSRDSILFWVSPEINNYKKYKIKLKESKSFKTKLIQPSDTILKFKTNALRNLKPQENLSFSFSQPIESIDKSKMNLLQNGAETPFEFYQDGLEKVIIASDFKSGKSYQFQMLPGSVNSFYGLTNDTLESYFESKDVNKYGNIKLDLNIPANKESIILELLQNEKVIQTTLYQQNQKISSDFVNLDNGSYTMRVIFDSNNNGLWDPGNYYNNLNPERVEYYETPIELRIGWDMEIQWDIR